MDRDELMKKLLAGLLGGDDQPKPQNPLEGLFGGGGGDDPMAKMMNKLMGDDQSVNPIGDRLSKLMGGAGGGLDIAKLLTDAMGAVENNSIHIVTTEIDDEHKINISVMTPTELNEHFIVSVQLINEFPIDTFMDEKYEQIFGKPITECDNEQLNPIIEMLKATMGDAKGSIINAITCDPSKIQMMCRKGDTIVHKYEYERVSAENVMALAGVVDPIYVDTLLPHFELIKALLSGEHVDLTEYEAYNASEKDSEDEEPTEDEEK